MTPFAAVAGGVLAGLAWNGLPGSVQYVRYRRKGGQDSPLAWEFAPVETWDKAPDRATGEARDRGIRNGRELPDCWAFPVSTIMHWAYGASAGGRGYGIVAGSLRKPLPAERLPFGTAVWLTGYAVLPQAGIYRQIWEYDAKTLAIDLSGHLAYGAGTGVAFWLLASVL